MRVEAQILREEGWKYQDIANKLGCHPSTVWVIVNGENGKQARGRGHRLAYDEINQIRADVASGELQYVVAKRFGVTQQTVSFVCKRKSDAVERALQQKGGIGPLR